jgi:adenylate kinase family enzyme
MHNCNPLREFKRINVCGSPGAGKSTLAKKISELTGCPYYDLDDYLYKDKCQRKSKEETRLAINELTSKKSFVIDGTYFTTFEERLNNLDAVILIDSLTILTVYNFFKRLLVNPNLKCGERITFKTFNLLFTFNFITRKKIIQAAKFKGVKIFIYKKTNNTFLWLN